MEKRVQNIAFYFHKIKVKMERLAPKWQKKHHKNSATSEAIWQLCVLFTDSDIQIFTENLPP